MGVPSGAARSIPLWPPPREPKTSETEKVPAAIGQVRSSGPASAASAGVAVAAGLAVALGISPAARGSSPGGTDPLGSTTEPPSQGSSTAGSTMTRITVISPSTSPSAVHSTDFAFTAAPGSRVAPAFVQGVGQRPVHFRGRGQLLLQQGDLAPQGGRIHPVQTRSLRGPYPVAHRIRVHPDLFGHHPARFRF